MVYTDVTEALSHVVEVAGYLHMYLIVTNNAHGHCVPSVRIFHTPSTKCVCKHAHINIFHALDV